MTLQEAKDQIAKKYDLDELPGPYNEVDLVHYQMLDEAAELYARSKWDEACEAQREMCSASWASSPYDVVSEREAIECAPKPEFKP